MTNWTTLVARLNKAEKDVAEWQAGLNDAAATLKAVRGEMASALGIAGTGNGSTHKASAAPVLRVARGHVRHGFRRKDRILSLLREKGGFLTIADVAVAEKCSATLAGHALVTLRAAGRLTRISRGRYAAASKAA